MVKTRSGAKVLRNRVLQHQLRAVQLHRWKEFAVRQLRKAQRFAGNSDEILDVVVPRHNIGIADGPIDGDPIAKVGFEVQVAPSVNLSAPHDGSPADLSPSNPAERLARRRGIRMLLIADEKLCRPFVARITRALDRLIFHLPAPIAHSAESHLPGRHMLYIVLLRHNGTARLEHQGLQPLLGQLFCGPASCHA